MFFWLVAIKLCILYGFVTFWARESLPGGFREASGGARGPLLGRSWQLLGALGGFWATPWLLSAPPGRSWRLLGASWGAPGGSWGRLGDSPLVLELILASRGARFGAF